VTTFDMLATSDRDLFDVCKPALLDMVCKDGDIVARADCLESRGAAYGQLHSPRMRRSWLIANGCPESTVDTPPKPEGLAVAPAPPPSKAADPIDTPAAAPLPPPAPAPAPVPPPEPAVAAAPVSLPAAPTPLPTAARTVDDSPPAALRAIAAAPPPLNAAPAPPPEPEPTPPLMAASARPPEPVAAKVARPPAPPAASPPPAPSAGSFSERERDELRERRLRDIIIAHGKEMKSCVDRQLKLVPDLRADGTLIIEVDANGAVPHAELLGTDLAGTPLESCLRTVASRWRFPSNGRAYRIDAPVKVSGSAHGR
jgi:hypothetical protein